MEDFTPIGAIVGGALIAISLGLMLVATGRLAGLSGVFAGAIDPAGARSGDRAWRWWFLGGMLATGALFAVVRPETFDGVHAARAPLWLVPIAGVLVGAGTRLGNGCTSGHGLCGISRLSRRSLIATATFFAIGVITATVVGRLS